jgi:hypothetical protein
MSVQPPLNIINGVTGRPPPSVQNYHPSTPFVMLGVGRATTSHMFRRGCCVAALTYLDRWLCATSNMKKGWPHAHPLSYSEWLVANSTIPV